MSQNSVRTALVTPEDNAQENNANPKGQFIEPEVAVPYGRGRGRTPRGIKIVEQGTVSSAQASSGVRQGSSRGRGREHEMTHENTVSRITRNTMNTRNTRNTSNEINSANSGSNRITTEVVTMWKEGSENENNYVNRKRKGCTYRTFSACNPPEFNGEGVAVTTIEQLEHEFLNLEQGDMSMREYTTRFNEKARFAKHHVQSEERRIHRYIWGMNSGIRELVKATRPKTYQEAMDAGNLKLMDGRSDKGGDMPKAKGRAYTMTINDAMKTSDVVSGTFLVNNIYANVSFDSGVNKSFVSATFCHYLNKDACRLDRAFIVETANGVERNHMYMLRRNADSAKISFQNKLLRRKPCVVLCRNVA
ncbi:putative reverse transcriptase domain-containing protein [Tanacetum coccineum]